jgi:hypothetical protein
MKSKVLVIVLIFTLHFLACKQERKFFREAELLHYLHQNDTLAGQMPDILLLLVGSGCGNCVDATKNILSDLNSLTETNIEVIIGSAEAYIEYNSHMGPKMKISHSSRDTLLSRGLSFSSDMLFVIGESGKIEQYWGINYESESSVRKYLNSKKDK